MLLSLSRFFFFFKLVVIYIFFRSSDWGSVYKGLDKFLYGFFFRSQPCILGRSKIRPVPPSLVNIRWNRARFCPSKNLSGPVRVNRAWENTENRTTEDDLQWTMWKDSPSCSNCRWRQLKGHSQLAHVRSRYYFMANLHITVTRTILF